MRISLVIPSIGRPSLLKTLASVRFQKGGRTVDEVLLIGDGPCPAARILWEQFGLPGRYVELPKRLGYWGHAARNFVQRERLVTGDWIMALDDDDVLTKDAVSVVRSSVMERRPYIFRMKTSKGVVWNRMEIEYGNVGTPMAVLPNDPAKLGVYELRYGGDSSFISETCAYYSEGPVWRPEVIAAVRPL